MNSDNIRVIEASISSANLTAAFEPILKQFGYINNDEEVVYVRLGKENNKLIPIRIEFKKEGEAN